MPNTVVFTKDLVDEYERKGVFDPVGNLTYSRPRFEAHMVGAGFPYGGRYDALKLQCAQFDALAACCDEITLTLHLPDGKVIDLESE